MKSDRLFAALWDRHAPHESKTMKRLRREAIGDLEGRVLEIGVGTGSNWPFVPTDVEYTGIEPNAAMLERAQRRARQQGRTPDLQLIDVEKMPFPDASFDTVFATITFCSVAHPAAGLAEVRRVLKPGGDFRFLEHVRARNPLLARLQWLLRPVTQACGGGCHWDRNTLAAIRTAGFQVEHVRRTKFQLLPIIVGRATTPVAGQTDGS